MFYFYFKINTTINFINILIFINRLVEIVERRNEIVECLEMDRRREIEEDRSIHKHMDLFAGK